MSTTVTQNGTSITVDETVVNKYGSGEGGATTLNALTDVDTTNATPGQVLKRGSDGIWRPADDLQGSGGSGTPGSQNYSGTTAPASGLGVNGDWYTNTTNGDSYRKESNAWALKLNLKGPQGNPGAKGDTGDAGPKGDTGLQGPKGDTGNTGNTGTTGATGDPGKSAYQVWLDAGNTGTQAQFLASLKGVQGDAGAKGDTGLQGPKGDTGNTGTTGNTGATGRSIQVFTSAPTGTFNTNYFAGDIVML